MTNHDPVLRLCEYWLRAKLMHEMVHVLRDVLDQEHPPPEDTTEFLAYVDLWLSTLWVVCEGFLELDLTNRRIRRLIRIHGDSLRLFRNGTFHFQQSRQKTIQFFETPADGPRLNWAEDLHDAFEQFFKWHINKQRRLVRAAA